MRHTTNTEKKNSVYTPAWMQRLFDHLNYRGTRHKRRINFPYTPTYIEKSHIGYK